MDMDMDMDACIYTVIFRAVASGTTWWDPRDGSKLEKGNVRRDFGCLKHVDVLPTHTEAFWSLHTVFSACHTTHT